MIEFVSETTALVRRCSLLLACAWGLFVLSFGPMVIAAGENDDASSITQGATSKVDESLSQAIGRRIDDFDLADFHGRRYTLSDFDEYPLLVVAFLGVECPLAKQYVSRLVALSSEYASQGVGFVGIDSNVQDSLEELGHFARRHAIDFPLLRDRDHEVANRFDARRTPEVFVLDRERTIRYRGRIDDQYGFDQGTGYQLPEARTEDLVDAMVAVLAGKTVDTPVTAAPGCLIARTRAPDPNSPITWSKQIVRLFQRRCQECHRDSEIAPFPLLTFDDVRGWEAMIREVVNQNRMPPWHADARYGEFANDCRLTEEEKRLINRWVDYGAPEGDPADLPEPREFVDGWEIGEPDAVYFMRDEPFVVSAEGLLDYEYFIVDPGFTEDRWLKACECRPGNRSVVHHINVFILPPEMDDSFLRDQLTNRLLMGYSPGFRPEPLPSGMANRVRAGSRFVFQMHYTPVGTPQEDRSYMGVIFVDDEEVQQCVEMALAFNAEFVIPPGAANSEVKSMYEFKSDATLFALIPHMHLRGKSFRYEAQYIDGKREILLEVPRYDFNWQGSFVLQEPRQMPAGTVVECTAVYDNSADNLANPNPNVAVHWGDQTIDEMMIGYLHLARTKDVVDAPNAPPEPRVVHSDSSAIGDRRFTWVAVVVALLGSSAAMVVFGWRMREGARKR